MFFLLCGRLLLAELRTKRPGKKPPGECRFAPESRTEPAWFDRELGLYHFINDLGLQPGEGYTLKRKSGGKDYTVDNYQWVAPVASLLAEDGEIRRSLAQRYYAVKKQAKDKHREFHWMGAAHFIDVVLDSVSADFNLSDYRMKWNDPAVLGYGPDNFRWVRLVKLKNMKGTRTLHSQGGWNKGLNFAGYLVDSHTYALCHMTTIEVLLADDFVGGVEDAIQETVARMGNLLEGVG